MAGSGLQSTPIQNSPFKTYNSTARLSLHVAALLGYAALGLVMTWPLLLYWDSGFLGFARSFEDGAQNVWNMWWMRWALANGQSPFWNPLLYYPEGLQMYLQAISAPGAFLALPITYLAGPVAAYNTATLTAFALTGYGVFLLARAFVPGWAIPLLCGALVVASPFFVTRLQTNQLNLTSMQWLPFYFLALIQLEQRRSWWPVAGATALVVLLVLTDWYWTMACLLYTAVWAATGLLRAPDRWWFLRRYLIFGISVLAVLAPFFYAIAQTRAQLPIGGGEDNPAWDLYVRGFSADALGLLYPAAFQPLWAEPVQRFLAFVAPGPFTFEGWYVAAGWVLLALAGLGIWWGGREQWRLLVAGASGWFFALGPSLRIFGRDTELPLPYALIQDLPLLSTARRPNLFAVPCIVLAAVFAAIALHRLAQRMPARRRAGLLLPVAALAAFELWPPAQHDRFMFESSPLVARLRERPGAVADLPYERQESSRSLRNQIMHEQPILGGYVSRRPRYESLRYMPHLSQISSLRRWPGADIVPLSPEMLAAMQCAYPLRHVLVRKEQVSAAQMQALAAVLADINGGPLPAAGEDSRDLWYELPLFPDRCQPFLYLGRGWYGLEGSGATSWRWASGSSQIWLVNPFDQPIVVTLRLTGEAFETERSVALWRGDERLVAWNMGRAARSYRLAVRLPPGASLFQLRSDATADPATGRELSISVRELVIQSYTEQKQRGSAS